jgi:hypothetical protein
MCRIKVSDKNTELFAGLSFYPSLLVSTIDSIAATVVDCTESLFLTLFKILSLPSTVTEKNTAEASISFPQNRSNFSGR